jgi:hypothetical protein
VPSGASVSAGGSSPESWWNVCLPGPQPLPSRSTNLSEYGAPTLPGGQVLVFSPATFRHGSSEMPPPEAVAAIARDATRTGMSARRLIRTYSAAGRLTLLQAAGLGDDGLAEEVEKLADLVIELRSVAHRDAAFDRVLIAPSDASTRDVAGVDEIGDDSLRSPLRDPDRLGDVAQAGIRTPLNAQEHLSMARQEVPAVLFRT